MTGRRRRLRWQLRRLGERWENLLYRSDADAWLWWWPPEPVSRALCALLGGHEPVEDQCGRPEHDYCAICGVKVPDGAAAERADRLELVEELRAWRAREIEDLRPRTSAHLLRLYGSLDEAKRRG